MIKFFTILNLLLIYLSPFLLYFFTVSFWNWRIWNDDGNLFHYFFSPIRSLLKKRRERRVELKMAELRKELETIKINTNNNISDIDYYSDYDSGYFW